MTDNDILLAIRSGALRAALYHGKSSADADDIAQDVVLKFIERQVDNPIMFCTLNSASGWGMRVAKNLMMDRHKKRKPNIICLDCVRYLDNI